MFKFKFLGGGGGISVPDIELPIGISFFTFQALSYTLDICMGKYPARKNLFDVALYISFFPQLIAGPIVRYETINEQIENRKESFTDFSEGVYRFIIGLSKKIIIANQLASISDAAFAIDNRSFAFAWLGAIAYSFQIFYDFSGYSDMAIGLGKIFGFHFWENFNYPYVSKSVSEFWRRWHISLGTWFRDYIYFPLGGSHVNSKLKLSRNLLIVWFLTGVWHGANWTFIIWGLMYFVIISFEKVMQINNKMKASRLWALFGHFYTMVAVVIGWVIFRSDTIIKALEYIKNMFGFNITGLYSDEVGFWISENKYFLLLAFVFSLPVSKWIQNRFSQYKLYKAAQLAYPVLMSLLMLVLISYLVKGSYNPFIYFNF